MAVAPEALSQDAPVELDEASLRMLSVPPVALGLPERTPESPAAEAPNASPAEQPPSASSEDRQPEPAADAGTETPAEPPTPEPSATLTREEHEREIQRRIGEYQRQRDADAIAKAEAEAAAKFVQEQEALLERAMNGDEEARAQWDQNRTVQALRDQVRRDTAPVLQREAQAAVALNLDQQYRQGYLKLAEQFGPDVVAEIDHGKFDNAADWVVALATAPTAVAVERAVAEARAKWEKDELPAAREAAAAQARAELRGRLPMPDTNEGVAGGLNANGAFQTKADLDAAMAAGTITAAAGRAIAMQRGWFRVPGRR